MQERVSFNPGRVLSGMIAGTKGVGLLTGLAVSLATAPPVQAQGRLWRVPPLDSYARAPRAMNAGLVMDQGDPTVLVAENWGSRIVRVRIDRNGRQGSEVVAGTTNGGVSFTPDGARAIGAGIGVSGIGQTSDGRVLFVDAQGLAWGNIPSFVRMIERDGRIVTVAGTRESGAMAVGVPATQARLGWRLGGIAVGARDEIFVADCPNDRIVKFSLGGSLEVVAPIPAPGNLALWKDELHVTHLSYEALRKVTLADGQVSPAETGPAPFAIRALSLTSGGERLLVGREPEPENRDSLFSLPPDGAPIRRLTGRAPDLQDGCLASEVQLSCPMAVFGADEAGILVAERRGLFFLDRAGDEAAPDAAQLREWHRSGRHKDVRAGILALKVQAMTELDPEGGARRRAWVDDYFLATRPHRFPPELVDLVDGYERDPQAEMMRVFRARLMLNKLLAFPEFRVMPELEPSLADQVALALLARMEEVRGGAPAPDRLVPSQLLGLLEMLWPVCPGAGWVWGADPAE